MPIDSRRVQSVFLAAVEADEPAARAAVLDRECGTDAELRQRVEALLRAHDDSGSLLAKPAADLWATAPLPPGPGKDQAESVRAPEPTSGGRIGPYKLLQQIGEGGMGAVWMAEQQEPVRRMVALKVVKAGLDSAPVLARFEAERQALALMDHPHIAQVFDGGTTASGRPYFVMELVKGTPITKYCDEHRLTPKERLGLFVPVCQAVQHAHQKGIIHRDLKPSNVLVAPYDGRPVVKVIDFGLAKAAGQRLTERTLFTGFGMVVGTLGYMSPEQAELNNQDIDTRSDVYSLGVLLYELLTGTTPLTKERLKQTPLPELLRLIREEEPPKPSTRLSEAKASLASVSAQRQTGPAQLTKQVRGELDWIVMKALDKDRARRYETANDLARDVERYLRDEPVLAGPPSAAYRLRKFMRRHKTALSVAGLILFFIALVGGGGGWLLRDRAAREQEVTWDRAAREAETGRALDEAQDWLDRERLPEATAAVMRAEALVAGAAKVDEATRRRVQEARRSVDLMAELDDARFYSSTAPQRESSAEQDRRFKKIFEGLGIDVDALSTDEAAERIKAHPLHRHLALALDSWANTRLTIWGGREEQRDAEWWKRLLRVAAVVDSDEMRNRVRTALLNNRERKALLIDQDSKTLEEMADSPNVGRLPVATVTLLARALHWGTEPKRRAMAVRVLKEAHAHQPDHFGLNMTLGYYLALGPEPRKEEALSYLRAAQAIRPRSRQVPAAIADWALRPLNRMDEALPILSAAIEMYPDDAMARNNRGAMYGYLNQWDQEIADCSKAIELDPHLAHAWLNRSNGYYNKKTFDKARDDADQAVKLDPKEAKAWGCRGLAYLGLGQWEKARDDFTQSIRLDDNWVPAWTCRAKAHEALKQYKEAAADYSRAIALELWDIEDFMRGGAPYAKAAEDARRTFAESLYRRGNLYAEYLHEHDKDYAKAISDFSRAILMNPELADAWLGRGFIYRQREQWNEAHRDLSRFLELAPKTEEKAKKEAMAEIWFQRGITHDRLGHPDKALLDFSTALDLNPMLTKGWDNRGWTYSKLGRYEDAVADYSRAIELMPKDPHLRVARGAVYCDHLKQYDKAVADFSRAIELDEKDPHAWYNRGWAYSEWGQYENAVASLSRAIELMPNELRPLLTRGAVYCDHLKQYDKAIADFSQAIKIDPKSAPAYYNLGRALQGKGRPDDAIAAYQKSVQFNENDDTVQNTLGNALFDRGRMDEAIVAYQKAIRLKKDDASYHYNLGNAFVKKGRLDDAVTEHKTAIRLRENFPDAYICLGVALAEKGRTDDAIAAYEKAIQLKKDDPKAYYNYGKALHDKGRLDDAIKAFENAIQLKNNEPSFYTALGGALGDRGRIDDAIAAFKNAIRIDKNDGAAHNGLGIALQNKNQLDAAIAEHKKAIEIDEKVPAFHNCLGVAYAKQNRLDDAITEFRRTIALKPDYVGAHANLGNALHIKGDRDGAIAAYRKAIEVDEKYVPAHYNLGNVLREKGDLTGAKAAYQRVIALQSDHVLAHWNLGLLLEQEGEFRKALEELRRGHALNNSKDAGWAQRVRECERLVELDDQLPRFLEGKMAPASSAERIELARLCNLKRLHHAAARFYEEAFTKEPQLADDLAAYNRYNAACEAALAGCGQGKDADKLDDKERARLRRQALDWLRADREARVRLLDKEPDKDRIAAQVARDMQHWLSDTDLTGVRGAEALAKLPEAERKTWEKLWDDVAETSARAQKKTSSEKK